MDRSLFLSRLLGPTFVTIALGMLINLNMYASMIAEALNGWHRLKSIMPSRISGITKRSAHAFAVLL
ncbi:hypothetical protein [Sinorhizobium sp. CB7]|uniref:hypothetical protein n=1 Tax=Sinorhizobium sp. CB7 TaxID=3056949 RepID=UPI003525D222